MPSQPWSLDKIFGLYTVGGALDGRRAAPSASRSPRSCWSSRRSSPRTSPPTRLAIIVELVAWAFSLAAASFFPALVMGIWWRRANKARAPA